MTERMTDLVGEPTLAAVGADLRIAVIGCGRMGATRARSARQLGARVSWVVDADAQRSRELAADYPGCTALLRAEELPWSEVDAVFVCTPPAARGPIELEAIAHGVPLFVEKPLGLDAASVAPLTAALAGGSLPTAVGYMNRYRESVQRARAVLQNAQPLGFAADWLVGTYAVPWWTELQGSGGPINEQATHIIDLARFLVDEIVEVQALAQPLSSQPELVGTASISLRFANGVLGSFLYSCEASQKMIRVHAYSSDSLVALEDWDFRWGATPPSTADRNAIFVAETAAFFGDVAAFRRSDASTSAVLCDIPDALATQRVVDAVHRALRSGRVEPVVEVVR